MGADDKSPAREGASQYTAMGYRLLYLRPTVIVSLLLVLLVVVTGAAGSLIAPHDPERQPAELGAPALLGSSRHDAEAGGEAAGGRQGPPAGFSGGSPGDRP